MNQVIPPGAVSLILTGPASAPIQPPLGGGDGSTVTVTGESGAAGAGEGQAGSPPGIPGFGGNTVMWIFVILAIFIGLSLMSGRKEKKRRREMLRNLSKNSSVQTIGGIMGSVIEVKGDVVVLQVDESSKTRMTFSRAAIQQVLEPGEEAASN